MSQHVATVTIEEGTALNVIRGHLGYADIMP